MTEGALDAAAATEIAPPETRRRSWRSYLLIPAVLLVLLAVWYLGGMIWYHRIGDDPEFGAVSSAPTGGSRAIAIMADLIEREIDTHEWLPNEPFFKPGYLLDNGPNFQIGMLTALSRIAVEFTDQLGRSRGSSQADPDLTNAAGLLRYPPDKWIFDLSTSWAPTAPSEQQYRAAMRSLRQYNERLGSGKATFDRRSDNLIAALDRIAADLGSVSAASYSKIESSRNTWFDFSADDLFYSNKGLLYGYHMVLRDLGEDFAQILAERQATRNWSLMLESLRHAALLQPLVVLNGALDSMVKPNHLANQAFLLLRARIQLREVGDILTK